MESGTVIQFSFFFLTFFYFLSFSFFFFSVFSVLPW